MPTALHPQAKFDPLPPDLDLHALVERTPNFDLVKRISAAQIRNIGQREFEKFVHFHVIKGGKPLVIEKWNDRLPKSLFSGKWLEETYNKKEEKIRDINNQTDIPMTTGHYLRSLKQLTNQWRPDNFRDERRQRLYMKDIDCPPEWQERLRNVIPPNLYYWNENVEQKPRRRPRDDMDDEAEEHVPAPAGDLMSSLPLEMRAQNLMCYVGHEGTYTPAHREMCASLGQNIMVDASGDENGEKPGSSIWFMTETKDREVVREYFLSMLGHDVEIEKHFAQVNAWKKAPFPVYIVEQKVGDFILVPPLAPHQVWNRGTRTIKVAWNRITVETLELALHEALPKARLVCRDEQYKNKAIIYYTLQKYYRQMEEIQTTASMQWLGLGQDLFKDSPRVQQLAKDFKQLLSLFTDILVDEMFATKEKNVEYVEYDSCVTCSYCRANIFNRFLTCKHCVRQLANGDEDTYDICMECYTMGRSCLCISGLSWCEQWKWSDLVENYEAWRTMAIKNDGYVDFNTSPLPLEIARRRFGKKSVAQICQEQLKKRPFKDITKPEELPQPEPEPEPEVDDEGRVIKKKKNRRKPKTGDVYKCHVCFHKDNTYKLAYCTNPGCIEAYCYGVLYRAFDQMPQQVMEAENWQCPKCRNICNCGACRRAGRGEPYIPKNTLLGHDTRHVADDRSVESLVDFRVHNLGWLKANGEETRSSQTKRIQRLQEVADAEKAKGDELAHNLPALPDGEDDSGLHVVRQALENGFEDQSHAAGPAAMGEHDMGMPDGDTQQQPAHAHQPAGPAAEADMSLMEDNSVYPSPSNYPDPSMLGQDRRLGMGYYEPDDAPDRILFDPYQAPTAEAIAAEPEVSEYVKKALRAAKRRARREEDDDPDFGPARPHKKRARTEDQAPVDAQQEALNNMDPALFDQDLAMPDAPMEVASMDIAPMDVTPTGELPQNTGEAAQEQEEAGEEIDDEFRPFTINRPALRHARPMISYADADQGEEEFNEILIPKPAPPAQPAADTGTMNPLDAASAAIMALTRPPGETPTGESSGATPAGQPKKKGPGRPPGGGKPRKPDFLPAVPPLDKTSPPPPTTFTRSGRPTRPSLAHNVDLSGSEAESNTGKRRRGRGRPSRASLANEAEASDFEGSRPTEKRRRGRPSKASLAKSAEPEISGSEDEADAQLAATLDAFDDHGEFLDRDASPEKETAPPPKRRGRPPKNKNATPAAKPPTHNTVMIDIQSSRTRTANRASSPPQDLSMLSLRERMALKGKKVKIAARTTTVAGDKNSAPATPASKDQSFTSRPTSSARPSRPSTAVDKSMADDDDFIPGAEEELLSSRGGSSEPEESAPPPLRSTIVRPHDNALDHSDVDTFEASPAPPASAPKPSGPTVIRLADLDSEEDESGSEVQEDQSAVSSSSGSDDDDEDIPAQKAPARGTATRGRGRGRPRGTATRGRGRGRGRG
jgi:hypothetical protein